LPFVTGWNHSARSEGGFFSNREAANPAVPALTEAQNAKDECAPQGGGGIEADRRSLNASRGQNLSADFHPAGIIEQNIPCLVTNEIFRETVMAPAESLLIREYRLDFP
jgi:hypothetical protein